MNSGSSALIIAGTSSGCGKTTVTLGVMAALCKRGVRVQPFKCGPDFIDPTLHRLVTGRVSRNLDVRMCGADYVEKSYFEHLSENGVSIIEGVMGLFDGGNGSAARLASLLQIPVVLVVDVRSAAESVAAVIKGFETFDDGIRLVGVILNRVGSERHLQMITDAVGDHCRVEILGALPRDNEISMPSRHLGLHMGPEMQLDQEHLVNFMEKHVDLDRLMELADSASSSSMAHVQLKKHESVIRLGLARDEAFCFYYQDNLDMLAHAGAEIVEFSPMHDKKLPENLDGLYFGGGYPELHGAGLAANTSMRKDVLQFSRSGRAVYGECGGFMYLCESIIDTRGRQHSMAGIYPVHAKMGARLRRLGYRQVEIQEDTLLGARGTICYGHEFHYSTIESMPERVERVFRLDDDRFEGYRIDNTLAGYVHLHWGRTPDVVHRFVDMMASQSEVESL